MAAPVAVNAANLNIHDSIDEDAIRRLLQLYDCTAKRTLKTLHQHRVRQVAAAGFSDASMTKDVTTGLQLHWVIPDVVAERTEQLWVNLLTITKVELL